jgi:hypothetical protein
MKHSFLSPELFQVSFSDYILKMNFCLNVKSKEIYTAKGKKIEAALSKIELE